MNETEKYFSAIILAAGKSERLGFPKLSLDFDNKISFIEHIAWEYEEFGCKEIVVVVNDIGKRCIEEKQLRFPNNTKILINEHPEWHRFHSLKLGAKALKNNYPVFIHNVDNPFVNDDVLGQILNCSDKSDYISPEYEGKGGHPFLISNNIIKDLKLINQDQMHLKEFLNQYSRLRIPVSDEKVLVNINTLEEYRRYF